MPLSYWATSFQGRKLFADPVRVLKVLSSLIESYQEFANKIYKYCINGLNVRRQFH